ncbi:MAG: hypothetical protein IH840_05475 [Candidatus Heimdallarchaeota archaeon]|nr:hypothetical protein [Candidatus Heimdallarchaeota archaeon]
MGNGSRAAGIFGGTSEAAPRVSGILALMIEAFKGNDIIYDFGDIRVHLKSNAVDLGFPATHQGAGLVNAFDAVSSIINGDQLLISSTSGALIFGERLQSSFSFIFTSGDGSQLNHPLIEHQYPDFFLYLSESTATTTQQVEFYYGDGLDIQAANYIINPQILTQSQSSEFEFNSTAESLTIVDLESIWDLEKSWRKSDFFQISLSLTSRSFDNIRNVGISLPEVTIRDSSTGNIVIDASTEIGWMQQFYIGNPVSDFQGDPLLEFVDEGYILEVPGWTGLQYLGYAQAYDYTEFQDAVISANTGQFGFSLDAHPTETLYASLSISLTDNSDELVNIPLTVTVDEQVGYGDNARVIGSDLVNEYPYQSNSFFGSFDWGFRPESGDFRSYRLDVPSNATYLALQGTWAEIGFLPDFFLFNEFGLLVATSDVTYVGGGFYSSSTSEEFAQNLLVAVDSLTYTLLVHVVKMPFSPIEINFNLITRYLVNDPIPSPMAVFTPEPDVSIDGDFEVSVEDYSLDDFPELSIQAVAGLVYQGTNGTLDDNLDVVAEGPTLDQSMIEKRIDLPFEQGEKVILFLTWEEEMDLDMYVVPPGEEFTFDNDLLTAQGTFPGSNSEIVVFGAPTKGIYSIYIDYIRGSGPKTNLEFSLQWESRDGPTLTDEGPKLTIPTNIFPNGFYGLVLTYFSNFNLEFTEELDVEFFNHFDFYK